VDTRRAYTTRLASPQHLTDRRNADDNTRQDYAGRFAFERLPSGNRVRPLSTTYDVEYSGTSLVKHDLTALLSTAHHADAQPGFLGEAARSPLHDLTPRRPPVIDLSIPIRSA
jgi:hypothetical protein